MSHNDVHHLVRQLHEGLIDRRAFLQRAIALGLTPVAAGAIATSVLAQQSTPEASPSTDRTDLGAVATPGATPEGGQATGGNTMTREEYQAQVDSTFPFEEPQVQGGQLIQVETTDIQTLNTVLSSDVYSTWIAGFVFDFLIGSSVVDGLTVPGLADSWEVAEDGITYTVHLHQGVMFHDGEPLTADDVVYTFDAALAEDSLSPRKGTVEAILDSYRKVDDFTVEFKTKFQTALFATDVMGQFGIMPKHIWESVPFAEWASDPGSTGEDPSRVVGSGPFRFVEWALGDHVTLEKNADYWDTPNIPVIDTYTFQVIVDPASAIAALQTGQSDMTEIPFGQANPLRESNPELQILDFDTTAFNYFLTFQDPEAGLAFSDANVRRALLYALDRDLMADVVYEGFAIRADGIYNVLHIAYDPDRTNTIYTYDPEMAQSLLEESGWVAGPDGIREKDGERLAFEMFFSEGVATYETQVPYMQQAWREVGMEMLPTAIPFPTLSENGESGNFQMILQGLQGTIQGDLSILLASDQMPPAGLNRMRYSNPEFDALVEPSKMELDVEKRIDLLIEMGNIANDDAAVGINVFRKDIYGASPRLHNFFPNGYSEVWWVTRAWLDQG